MTRSSVALVDTLLTAMVRADGEALVMHVGERPIVIAGARTIDLSAHAMSAGAMLGMLFQLLSADALAQLKEAGAVEHELGPRGADRFTVVAARSGDDLWLEIRRRRPDSVRDVASDSEPASSQPDVQGGGGDREAAPASSLPAPVATATSLAPAAVALKRLLEAADVAGASDLVLLSQSSPFVRVDGRMRALPEAPELSPAEVEALLLDTVPESSRDALRRGEAVEWSLSLDRIGRLTATSFRDHRGAGATFHFEADRPLSGESLPLSAEARLLATEPDGLILIAAPAGHDTAALLRAFVDLVNEQRADYVVALESVARAPYPQREALISQRAVGADPARVIDAARAALRERPDVLAVERIGSPALAELALDASGDRLVVGAVEASSATAALQSFVGLLPDAARDAATAQLAARLSGVIIQLVLRRASGGRVAARELMVVTRAVARMIADGNLAGLDVSVDQERPAGTVGLTAAIVDLVKRGDVDVREALRRVPDADRLLHALAAAEVDLSAAARWR